MKFFKLRKKADIWIAVAGISLSLVGLVMILSASQISAADTYGNPYYFFYKQLGAWVVGLGLFFYLLKIPLETLFNNRGYLLLATVIMLILVFVPIIGPEAAGVHRWIDIGITRIQPSEIAKLLLVIYFAAWFAAKQERVGSFIYCFLPFIAVLSLIIILIMLQPDMGTMVIITSMAVVLYFVGGAHPAHIITVFIVGALAMFALATLTPYRAERVKTFLNRDSTSEQSQNEGYHTYQALLAIGSGGMWGVGFGQSTSKYSYLPQSHTDSIFAVIAEELGYVRTMVILLGYVFITWKGFTIARHANSRFAQLLAVGLTTLIFSQAIINISGMLHMLPLTGVPLPFISFGGTSMVVCLGILGLITNVSREVV